MGKLRLMEFEASHGTTTKFRSVLEAVPSLVIFSNVIVMGFSLDFYPGHSAWKIIELSFTLFFIIEYVSRLWFCGYRREDRFWNCFDLFCICTAVVDSYFSFFYAGAQMPIRWDLVTPLRLARLARLVRLLRFGVFADLRMMIVGILTGMHVLVWAIVLLALCIFSLGITLRLLLGEQPEFRTLAQAMLTLFRCFTDGCAAYDGTPLASNLHARYGVVWTLSYCFVTLFVMFGIFNLIMATFLETVLGSAHHRKLAELGANAAYMRLNQERHWRFLPRGCHLWR